jgi:nucleoside-diphosphate-sugar epimerase
MRVFVLGGTGFVGRHVVRRLHGNGHEVVVFHRGQTRADLPAAVRSIVGDRRDLASFTAEIERCGPDVVIDVIPYTEPEALDVMQVFRSIARRVVALSSGDVYRNYDGLRRVGTAAPDPCPLAEDAPLRESLYPYRARAQGPADRMFDYEKILVERAVLSDPGLPGTVLRLPMVYGPGDPQHRLFSYVNRMDHGRPAILMSETQAEWRWTRGYVENVAAAAAHAAADDRAAGQVYNIGEADAPTEAEWVAEIGRASGWEGKVAAVPSALLPAGLVPDLDWRYHLATDTARFRGQLGFVEPIARGEALQRTIDWERAHPPREVRAALLDYAAEDAALASARRQ